MGERMDRRWYCEAKDHSAVLGWPPCAVIVRGEGQMEGGDSGADLCAAQACPLRASSDAQAAKPSTQLVVVRGRMNRRLLFFIVLGRLFNRSPFVFVRRSNLSACRVLSSDAQQHSATAQA
jgi:hypothetical protein